MNINPITHVKLGREALFGEKGNGRPYIQSDHFLCRLLIWEYVQSVVEWEAKPRKEGEKLSSMIGG